VHIPPTPSKQAAITDHIKAALDKESVDWATIPHVDPAKDSAALEAEQEAKAIEAARTAGAAAAAKAVPVDKPAGDLVRTCAVHVDPVLGAYDIMMTCTDTTAGHFGRHSFYTMQVLVNKLQGLSILWTRWGRVGETGQYQQTPFSTLDLTCQEFKKVFRSKSGQTWESQVDGSFVAQVGKYVPNKMKKSNTAHLLQPIHTMLQQATKEKINVPAPTVASKQVQKLIHALCDVSLIHQTMNQLGYGADRYRRNMYGQQNDDDDEDEATLISKLSREVLHTAHDKLKKLAELIPELVTVAAKINQQTQIKQQMEYQLELRERERRDIEAKDAEARAEKEAARQAGEEMDDGEQEEQQMDVVDIVASPPASAAGPIPAHLDVGPVDSRIAELQLSHHKLDQSITDLSNAFFTLVPQPGFKTSAIRSITTKEQLQYHLQQVLQFLDLHVTKRLLLGGQFAIQRLHPVDYAYSGLGISLQRLRHSDAMYKALETYVYASGSDRNSLEIYNIFVCS
jgi:predicted DNA-binding WGR domain protein